MHVVTFPRGDMHNYTARRLNGAWVVDTSKVFHSVDGVICGVILYEGSSNRPLFALPQDTADLGPREPRVPGLDLPDM